MRLVLIPAHLLAAVAPVRRALQSRHVLFPARRAPQNGGVSAACGIVTGMEPYAPCADVTGRVLHRGQPPGTLFYLRVRRFGRGPAPEPTHWRRAEEPR